MTSRLAALLAASPHPDLRGDFGRIVVPLGWLSSGRPLFTDESGPRI